MAGGIEKHSSNHSRPEGVSLKKVQGKIEYAEFACTRCGCMNRRPAAWNQMGQRDEPDDCPANVNHHLNHVCPDHRRESALKCVNQGEHHDDCHSGHIAHVDCGQYH